MSNIWKIIAAAGLALLIAGGLFDLTADGSTLICRGFRFTHEKE